MSDSYLYWEDFAPGTCLTCGPKVVTREEIIEFAEEFDPQPMHLDEEAAANSLLGGLAASGWHSCAILMSMLCKGYLLNSSSMGAPGVDEVKWLIPIYAGDTIMLKVTVLESRPSASRSDMGLVRTVYEMTNQKDELVMTMNNSSMFARRPSQEAQS